MPRRDGAGDDDGPGADDGPEADDSAAGDAAAGEAPAETVTIETVTAEADGAGPARRPRLTAPGLAWRPRLMAPGRRRGGRGRGGPGRRIRPPAQDAARRLVCGALLRRLREPGQGEPGEPHPVAQHGGLHLPDRGARAPGHRDQGRQAPAGLGEGAARLHPGPDGPDRPVLGRGPQHARRDRVRRPVQQAVAAQPGRGRRRCSPPSPRSRSRRPRPSAPWWNTSLANPLLSWTGRSPRSRQR